MIVFWAVLLVVLLLIGWGLTVIGMPGNWLIVVATAVYAWLVPPDSALALGWPVVLLILGLAVLGEVLESLASAFGAAKGGGSKRAAVLALAGSIIGGIAGLFVGVPIPVVGSLFAALLFGGLGALAGAMVGETWKGRDLDESWRVGKAAFWGRLLGTLTKSITGSVMVVVTVVALAL